YLYWGSRLLSSGIPWDTLASYDFIRWQLRIFIGFLPFFVFATPHLFANGRSSRHLAFVFVVASTAVVLAGAVQFVCGLAYNPGVGEHEAFRGMPIRELFGESWFLGLHRSHAASGGFYLLPTIVSLSLFLFWRMASQPPLLTFGLFAVSLWGLVFTKTRAAYLAFACAFIIALVVYGIERVKGQGPQASHPLVRVRLTNQGAEPPARDVPCA
ncbi:MAG: hypothetical protein HYZ81_11660, partial [Nitrospinae bacterium]|nr:hypothetical protein [Nitrospinota bacterium]